jgi:hypothetical protein
MEPCDHAGFHTGQGRYDHAAQRLRYVVVCDACESEVREIESTAYRPSFEPEAQPAAA